jgi:hypothetical protein
MEIIILLIVLVLAVFVMRALFNSEWRNGAQAKVDTVKKERIFWALVNNYGNLLTINAIFTIYLEPGHLATFIKGSSTRTDADLRVLKVLNKKDSFECIKNINSALEKADKTIVEILAKDSKSYTKADIKKFFEAHKDEHIFVPEQYDKFVSYYFHYLPDVTHLKSNDVWDTRKKLEEDAGQLEWKTEEVKVDAETLFAMKKSNVEIGEVVANILCGKEVANGALRDALTDWEHLHMLRWCIVDFVVAWHNTNLIQRFMWRVVSEFAS